MSNTLGKQGNLSFGAAGIFLVLTELFENLRFFFFCNLHLVKRLRLQK